MCLLCHVSGTKGQGIHPNDDHQEGQNRQRKILFEIWGPKTILKYPPRGATGNFYALKTGPRASS